mmetsp:Transcript_13892/g.29048  ORF Transcript_13892/g.29048 Transcript_13892/m.29048 type:complete len:219 (+) Transcript_13892:1-657(+)
MLVWHYVLHDLPSETPYCGGVYWGRLVFPKEYPLKPPAIYMNTPSGRFETHTRLCLSMSDFHPESWNPSWRIESILLGLVSFMLDTTEPRTTGGIHTSAQRRREYAMVSFVYNQNNAEFRELFPEFLDEAKRLPCGGFFLGEPPAAFLRQAAAAVGPALDAGRPGMPLAGAAQAAVQVGGGGRQDGALGMPAALLALSVFVLIVSCIGLFIARSGGSR